MWCPITQGFEPSFYEKSRQWRNQDRGVNSLGYKMLLEFGIAQLSLSLCVLFSCCSRYVAFIDVIHLDDLLDDVTFLFSTNQKSGIPGLAGESGKQLFVCILPPSCKEGQGSREQSNLQSFFLLNQFDIVQTKTKFQFVQVTPILLYFFATTV